MAWSSDGKLLASMDRGKNLKIWDCSLNELIRTIPLPEIFDWTIRWRADDQEVALLSSTGLAVRIQIADGKVLEQRKLSPPTLASIDQPFPDDDRRLSLENGGLIRVASKSLNRDLGHFLTWIGGRQTLCIGPSGHWRGSHLAEQFIRYVALDSEGRQITYTPREFASRFQWRNNPAEVSLAKMETSLHRHPRQLLAQRQMISHKIDKPLRRYLTSEDWCAYA